VAVIFKQINEIVAGQKTQTRRVVKPGEEPNRWFTDGPDDDRICEVVHQTNRMAIRTKWAIGHTYAVVPKCGQQTVWHNRSGVVHNGWCDWYYPSNPDMAAIALPVTHAELEKRGFRPLRIRITAIRQERLQDISDADAKAEGVSSKGEYAKLWNRINKRKGTRWSDNPLVWVLTFGVAQ